MRVSNFARHVEQINADPNPIFHAIKSCNKKGPTSVGPNTLNLEHSAMRHANNTKQMYIYSVAT